VTAAAVGAVVTLTYRHKGVIGNLYDVRYNYRTGDALPTGVGLTIVAVGTATAGTSTPVLTTLIANMANFWFHNWIHSFNDATSLLAIETDLETRFGPLNGKEGAASSAAAGTFSTLATLGNSRNSKQTAIWGQAGINPLTPPLRFAAACVAVATLAIQADPARPVQTLQVKGVVAPAVADLFTDSERNLLLYDGISTTKVVGDVVQLERWITTYKTSPVGAPDEAYLDVTTRFTLLYLRYDFRTQHQLKFPRHKLADDGTRFASGQAVMTPKIGKAFAVGWFRQKEIQGLVQNGDQFKRDLIVERQAGNPNQLNYLLPPTLLGKLIVTAVQLQPRLS
jgi:phage tail sheath gpL-like